MKFLRNLVILGFGVSIAGAHANPIVADYRLSASLNQAGVEQPLKSWTFDDLGRLKKISSREKDPVTGKVVNWRGVALADVIDAALNGQPADRKSQIDLVILKNDTGGRALIPRAFVVKYGVLLALARDNQKDLGEQGPIYSIAPWTSKPKVIQEGMPVESYFLPKVRQIEFANYREQYGALFLRRRTDPVAMRGEKLFIQNCVSCHAAGSNSRIPASAAGPLALQALASGAHPPVKGFVRKFNDKELRSLTSYLDAYRAENPLKTASN